MRRILGCFVLLCGLSAPAEAVTLRELIDLSKQGLSDDLLIALVEAEKSVFQLNSTDVKILKEQGLSDRLVIHLLQTPALRRTKTERTVERIVEPSPQVVIVERVETVPVPVFVAVPVSRRELEGDREKPVYWGYGGKLRPGSWK